MINFIKTFFHHFIDRATLIKSNTSKDKKGQERREHYTGLHWTGLVGLGTGPEYRWSLLCKYYEGCSN